MLLLPRPELLIFIDGLDQLQYANAYGADAFCLGLPTFSFMQEELVWSEFETCLALAQSYLKPCYILIDALIQNIELEVLKYSLNQLKTFAPVTFLIRDPGLIELIKELSYQAHIHYIGEVNNWRHAQFWQQQGIQRIFLPPSLTLEEVLTIQKNNPELELALQAHGQINLGYLPYTPAVQSSSCGSGGSCASKTPPKQESFYDIIVKKDQFGLHFLSHQTRCLLTDIPELYKHNISCLWLNCNNQSVTYCAVVSRAYADILQAIKSNSQSLDFSTFLAELEAVSHLPLILSDIQHEDLKYQESTHYQYDSPGDFVGLVKEIYPEANNKAVIEVTHSIKLGSTLHFISTNTRFQQSLTAINKFDGEEVEQLLPGDFFTMELEQPIEDFTLIYTKACPVKLEP